MQNCNLILPLFFFIISEQCTFQDLTNEPICCLWNGQPYPAWMYFLCSCLFCIAVTLKSCHSISLANPLFVQQPVHSPHTKSVMLKCHDIVLTKFCQTRKFFLCVYFPCCFATQEINTKITLLWALKQFVNQVHTLFSIYCIDCCICSWPLSWNHPEKPPVFWV